MKERVTLTIDPTIAKKAKRIAHARHTSVSALVEDLLRAASTSHEMAGGYSIDKWVGKFEVRRPRKGDARLDHLKKRYNLD